MAPILVSGLFLLPSGTSEERIVANLAQAQLLPLQGVSVHSQVVDSCAEVRLSQRFYNPYASAIEAVYVFPIDERAAVSSFVAHVGDRTIIGHVEEKNEARATYEVAKAQGHGAFLMEEVREDIFRVKVANILPGQRVEIEISYVCELKVEGEDGALRFLLPTAVAPRYTPASDWHQEPAPSSTPARVPDGLRFHMDAHTHSEIVSVTSPTHAIVVTKTSAKTASVDLAFESVSLGSDVVVLVHTDESNRKIATLVVEENTDKIQGEAAGAGSVSRACMLTLVPKFELDDVRTDIVFVIDRSGSMAGSQIEQARHAMELFLRSLPTDCYFNIVGFGSSYELLYPASTKYSQESLSEASAHVRSMQANLGGTELMGPLREISGMPPVIGYPRQVIVLTDGQVSNTEAVCRFVQGVKTARFFALGIGADVSHALVEGIARNGKGTAAFVHAGEAMETKVMRQLKQAIQPAISEVTIDWGVGGGSGDATDAAASSGPKSLLGYRKPDATEGPLMPAPYVVPPVFNGERFTVYCLLKDGVERPKRAIVRANTPDGPLEAEVALEEDNVVVGDIVHRLAARAILRDINDEASFLHKTAGGAGFRVPSAETVKAFAVQLGKRYRLASKYTSFVAVEERAGERVPVFYSRPEVEEQPAPSNVFATASGGGSSLRTWGAGSSGSAVADARLAQIARDIQSTREVMAVNINQVLSRGECLSMAQCDDLRFQSSQFHRKSKSIGGGVVSALGGLVGGAFSAAASGVSSLIGAVKLSSSGTSAAPTSVPISAAHADVDEEFPGDACDLVAPAPSFSPSSFSEEKKRAPSAPASAPSTSTSVTATAGLSDRSLLRVLVPLQQFDGSFLLSAQLADIIGKSLSELSAAKQPPGVSDEVWATALAIAVLSVRLGSLQEDWEMIADKARAWIRRSAPEKAQEVVAAAEGVVRG